MFHFFRKSPEPKKAPAPEREADGFVLLGEGSRSEGNRAEAEGEIRPEAGRGAPRGSNGAGGEWEGEGQAVESSALASELLRDVPFTLAPHVLAVQGAVSDLPSHLTSEVHDDLSRFLYDFTLENSVLCEP
uniref:UBAP1-MVB12-associated (UMA) domain containing 1 n=1 Tax=Sarcophilus harrisii TaxID=9305 RepID=G3VSI4_SARHA